MFPLTYYAAVSILVCFINPYGWNGVLYPFRQLQILERQNIFNSTIGELTSPLSLGTYFDNGRFILFQALFAFQIFLIISLYIFFRYLKNRSLTEILLYGAFCIIGISGVKNIGYFVFAVTPLIIKDISHHPNDALKVQQSNFFLVQIKTWTQNVIFKRIMSFIIIVFSVFLMFFIITDRYYVYVRTNSRFGTHYNTLMLPCNAAQFLRAHHLEGRILNQFSFGGFLMKTLPQPVSIDGRNEVTGEQFYAEYSALWNNPDKKPILGKFHPEIIIFSPLYELPWVDYLRNDSTWRLAFVDETAAIYLKVGYASEIPTVTEQSMSQGYKLIPQDSIDVVLHRPYPKRTSLFTLQRVYLPQKEICLSTFCYYNNWDSISYQIGLNGLMNATVSCPEMYYNLGNYFFDMRQFERSAYCYERFLETNNDPLARARAAAFRLKMIQ